MIEIGQIKTNNLPKDSMYQIIRRNWRYFVAVCGTNIIVEDSQFECKKKLASCCYEIIEDGCYSYHVALVLGKDLNGNNILEGFPIKYYDRSRCEDYYASDYEEYIAKPKFMKNVKNGKVVVATKEIVAYDDESGNVRIFSVFAPNKEINLFDSKFCDIFSKRNFGKKFKILNVSFNNFGHTCDVILDVFVDGNYDRLHLFMSSRLQGNDTDIEDADILFMGSIYSENRGFLQIPHIDNNSLVSYDELMSGLVSSDLLVNDVVTHNTPKASPKSKASPKFLSLIFDPVLSIDLSGLDLKFNDNNEVCVFCKDKELFSLNPSLLDIRYFKNSSNSCNLIVVYGEGENNFVLINYTIDLDKSEYIERQTRINGPITILEKYISDCEDKYYTDGYLEDSIFCYNDIGKGLCLSSLRHCNVIAIEEAVKAIIRNNGLDADGITIEIKSFNEEDKHFMPKVRSIIEENDVFEMTINIKEDAKLHVVLNVGDCSNAFQMQCLNSGCSSIDGYFTALPEDETPEDEKTLSTTFVSFGEFFDEISKLPFFTNLIYTNLMRRGPRRGRFKKNGKSL